MPLPFTTRWSPSGRGALCPVSVSLACSGRAGGGGRSKNFTPHQVFGDACVVSFSIIGVQFVGASEEIKVTRADFF